MASYTTSGECFSADAAVEADFYLPREEILRLIGDWAEAVIGQHYLRDEVRRPAFFPENPNGKDFHDLRVGTASSRNYVNFLIHHNPAVNADAIRRLATERVLEKDSQGKILYIPDIVTHDEPARIEFYEIKPNSPTGAAKGAEKVASAHGFAQKLGLDYAPGSLWLPGRKEVRIEIWNSSMFGVSARVEFRFQRDSVVVDGLVVYDFCIQVNGDPVRVFVLMLIIALILKEIVNNLPRLIPVLVLA